MIECIKRYLTRAYAKAQIAAGAVFIVVAGINLDDGISRGEWVQIVGAALGIGSTVGVTRNRAAP